MTRRVLPLLLVLGLTLPAAAALVLGPEKPVSAIATAPSPEDDRLSDAATDGTDFLVVWSSGWSTVHGVFAAKVAESGAVSPQPSLRLDTRDAIDVRVVWAGDAYLVLWTDTTKGIIGARIDRGGNLIAPPFLVSTAKYVHAVAWDGRRVVAISNIPNGTKILVLGPSGNIVRENDVPGVLIGGEARLLAAGGGFVLVWANNQRVGNAAVRAVRISPDGDAEAPVDLPQARSIGVSFDADTDGERIGLAYTESPSPGSGTTPSTPRPLRRYTLDARTLAYTEHSVLQSTSFPEVVPAPGGFLTAYIRDRAVLDAIPFESTEPRSTPVDRAIEQSLITVSNGRSVLAVWSRGYVAGAIFDAALTERKTPVFAVSTQVISQSRPVLAPANEVALAVWGEQNGEVTDLVAARVDRNGNALDTPRLIDRGEWVDNAHQAVFTGRVWLVAYYKQIGETLRVSAHVRRVGSNGAPLGEPIDLGESSIVAMASNGEVTVGVLPATAGVMVLRFTPDGTLIDSTPVPIDPNRANGVDVTTNGREFLVVWSADVPGPRILGKRLSATGNVVDAAPILIDDSPARFWTPRVASDGTDYFVAYLRPLSTSRTTVFVKKILSSGALGDATPSDGGTRIGDGHAPQITFSGTRGFVSYVSNPGPDVPRLFLTELGGETQTVADNAGAAHDLAARGNTLWISYTRDISAIPRAFIRTADETAPARRRTSRH